MTSRARTVLAVRQLYRAAAVSNAVVTLPAFLVHRPYVRAFAAQEEPNYPFLVRIWSGMALLWGVSFWDISNDPIERRALIKYSYLEKLVTSVCVLEAYRRREVPRRFAAMIVLTDVVWIPMFLWAERKVARL
jgi:alpha-beta hydrolase superfamily lysophospholipase